MTAWAGALRRASQGADGGEGGKGDEIGKIALKNVKLEVKGVTIEPFDADFSLDKTGKIVKAGARVRSGKWSLDFLPNKGTAEAPAGEGEWTVDFQASGIALPIGAPLPVTRIAAKGVMAGSSITFPDADAKLFEGTAKGPVKIDFKGGVAVTSEFAVERIKVDQLTSEFTKDVTMTGRMDGQFSLAASAPTVAELFDKPIVNGTFAVKDGAIGNVDIVQVMRTPGSVGGQTKFADLTGVLRVSDGVVRYEKLKLSNNLLQAGGAVSVVVSNSNLSGGFNAEIRSNVAQDRGAFTVSGKTARPSVKRG